MAQKHGLGPLKVRITGHQHVQVVFGKTHKGFLTVSDRPHDPMNHIPHIQPCIKGHLIVSAPPRVDFLSQSPHFFHHGFLNQGMNVLIIIIR